MDRGYLASSHTDMRVKVRSSFAELRKKGYLARMNHLCCQNCAGYDLACVAEKKKDKGIEVRGCVFYHRQDEETWRKYNKLYLAYGILGTQKHGDIGIPTVDQGHEIKEVLEKHGLIVEWDGDEDQRIYVVG